VEEYVGYYIENLYKSDYEKCTTDAEREKFKADMEKKVLNYYGEEYFYETIYYDYAIEEILKGAVIS
jgi:hypothetical protein